MIIVGPALAVPFGQPKLKDLSTYDGEVVLVPTNTEKNISEIKFKLRATKIDVYILGTPDSESFSSLDTLLESIDEYFLLNSPTPLTL